MSAILMRQVGTLLIAAVLGLVVVHATSADNLTEANMTQNDYDEIVKTESSVPGQVRAETPVPIHDLSAANQKDFVEAGSKQVIKGKAWKKMSTVERDKALRNLAKNVDPSTFLFIEVPSGNVWVVPGGSAFVTLLRSRCFRIWNVDEREKLPKSVRNGPVHPQEDRRSNAPTATIGANFKF